MAADLSWSETISRTAVRGDIRAGAREGVRLYDFLRPMIFRMTPETAHHVTLALLRAGGAVAPARWLLRASVSAGDGRQSRAGSSA